MIDAYYVYVEGLYVGGVTKKEEEVKRSRRDVRRRKKESQEVQGIIFVTFCIQ